MNGLPHITSPTKLAWRLIITQVLLVIILSILVLVFSESNASSFLMGAFVVILPTAWFACRFFHAWRVRSPKSIMVSLFAAEVAKLLFCAILAIIFVKYFTVKVGWFILGLAAAYVSFWVAVPIIIKNGTSSKVV